MLMSAPLLLRRRFYPSRSHARNAETDIEAGGYAVQRRRALQPALIAGVEI